MYLTKNQFYIKILKAEIMKKVVLFISFLAFFLSENKAQTISNYPTYNGTTTGVFSPAIVPNGSGYSNRKFPLDSFVRKSALKDTSAVLRDLIAAIGGGGSTYTAGNGLLLNGSEFKTDTTDGDPTKSATQYDLLKKANKASAGFKQFDFVLANDADSIRTDSILSLKIQGDNRIVQFGSNQVAGNGGTVVEFERPNFSLATQDEERMPYEFSWDYSLDNAGTYNTPFIQGFNPHGARYPAKWGYHTSMEPNYNPTSAQYKEYHIELYAPPSAGNPSGETSRTLSNTVIQGDSLGNTTSYWDMRARSIGFYTLKNKPYFSVGGAETGGSAFSLQDTKIKNGIGFSTDGVNDIINVNGINSQTGGVNTLKFGNFKRIDFSINGPYYNNDAALEAIGWWNMRAQTKFEIGRGGGLAPRLDFLNSAQTSPVSSIVADLATGGVKFSTIAGYYNVINGGGVDQITITNTGVKVGGTGTTVATSAQLEVNSTTKGFLPPRMTGTEADAIASKAEGLMVYITTVSGTFTAKGWYGWNGTAWDKLN